MYESSKYYIIVKQANSSHEFVFDTREKAIDFFEIMRIAYKASLIDDAQALDGRSMIEKKLNISLQYKED